MILLCCGYICFTNLLDLCVYNYELGHFLFHIVLGSAFRKYVSEILILKVRCVIVVVSIRTIYLGWLFVSRE